VATGAITSLGGPGARVAWTPDGTRAAVVGPDELKPGGGLTIVDLGAGSTVVVVGGPAQIGQMAWAPDGSALVLQYHPLVAAGNGGYRNGPGGLFAVAPDGSGLHQIFEDVETFAWTPDSSGLTVAPLQLHYTGNPFDIVTIDPATGAILSTTVSQTSGFCPDFLSWSPDGSYLAIGSGGPVFQPCDNLQGTGLWVWDSVSSALSHLDSRAFGAEPLWSPYGIVLEVRTACCSQTDIMVFPPDGGSPRVLAADVPFTGFPARPVGSELQTGGSTVLYSEYTCGQDGSLSEGAMFAVDEDGGGPRQISDPALVAYTTALAPDGATAAWIVLHNDQAALLVAPIAGGSARALLESRSEIRVLNWSPDGGSIAFSLGAPGPARCFGPA
jgi:Tol biopolymer transport system component